MNSNYRGNDNASGYQSWRSIHYPVPGSWFRGSVSSITVASTPNASEDFVTVNSTSSTEADDADGRVFTEDDLHSIRSRRRSYASGRGSQGKEEWAQIERLISRMFGQQRRTTSEEEKTRHVGVVWRNLAVKGMGLGAAIQPTNGDIFLGLPRLISGLLTRGRKGVGAKPPIRTILDDLSVSASAVERQQYLT